MTHFEDTDPEDIPRTAERIARRALVLSAVITAAYGSPAEQIRDWLVVEGLRDEITPDELKFLDDPSNKQSRINFTWRVEALQILLWCIQKIDSLPPLSGQCNTEPLKKATVFPPAPTAEFITSATLRDLEEIYDENERVYQAHWKVRDAEINDREDPKGLEPGVVVERHYAVNWVLGYMGQSWDHITTDT
jgi:hypothetical protein